MILYLRKGQKALILVNVRRESSGKPNIYPFVVDDGVNRQSSIKWQRNGSEMTVGGCWLAK